MEIKKIKLKNERRGPESEQKNEILKYLSSEILFELFRTIGHVSMSSWVNTIEDGIQGSRVC